MRKSFLLLVPVLGIMLISSCKKDYDCTCTTRDGTAIVSRYIFTVTDTKKNAPKKCEDAGTSGGIGTSLSVTCKASDRLY